MGLLGEPLGNDDQSVDGDGCSSSGVWCDTDSVRAVIRTAIATTVGRLGDELPGARLGCDPERVHQARVATRRLRSDLRTFASLLDHDWCNAVRRELGWLADRLGAVRDADVLTNQMTNALGEGHGAPQARAQIFARLADGRAQCQLELVAAIDAPRTVDLLDQLQVAAHDPPTTAHALGRAQRRLRPLARRPWKQLTRAVDDLGRKPTINELHRVRLLAKRARYAAEATVPTFGRDTQRFADALGGIQDVLGDMHDAENAAHWLEGIGVELEPAAAFAAGKTSEQLFRMADSQRTGWERSFARAERRSRWLGAD